MLNAASRGQCGTILRNRRQFYFFKSQRQADESVQGETPASGFFFFNRAPLLAQVSLLALSSRSPSAFFTLASRFLHTRLTLSSRLPRAFLCSPVKHKIMANVP